MFQARSREQGARGKEHGARCRICLPMLVPEPVEGVEGRGRHWLKIKN